MAKEREKNERLVTPAGIAAWPHLTTPDTKFDACGVYSTKVRFTDAAASMMKKLLDDEYEVAQKKAAAELKEKKSKKKVRPGPEPYEEDEDGAIIVNFKMKASGERKDGTKWAQKPAIFDAKGVPVKGLKIGGGSILKIATEINHYYIPALGAGVSLPLKAVQVIDLKAWGERTADAYGFDEEDGFDADEAPEDVFAGENEATPEDEDVDDDLADDEEPEEEEDDEDDF